LNILRINESISVAIPDNVLQFWYMIKETHIVFLLQKNDYTCAGFNCYDWSDTIFVAECHENKDSKELASVILEGNKVSENSYETILDELVKDAQEQNMGYSKRRTLDDYLEKLSVILYTNRDTLDEWIEICEQYEREHVTELRQIRDLLENVEIKVTNLYESKKVTVYVEYEA
jgi:hypothetical protein